MVTGPGTQKYLLYFSDRPEKSKIYMYNFDPFLFSLLLISMFLKWIKEYSIYVGFCSFLLTSTLTKKAFHRTILRIDKPTRIFCSSSHQSTHWLGWLTPSNSDIHLFHLAYILESISSSVSATSWSLIKKK